ncbi:MAG: hypothetical protein GWN14_06560, partial [candidate division Zixibacteria bacterium]|nr:hypothetical protein [candidate division Zixibacteria bacterium]NIW45404.1 hypothetical protein [Gammaproteobacteria bacterium]NIX55586.1 hypothetical protein [candidate division Zixibacteria bacterium]
MSEEQAAESTGQSESESQGTETNQPESEGQSAQTVETTETGSQETDTFFDPNQVPEDLQSAYKNMQASYTKKMQALSGDRQKIEAFDAFMSNPMGELQRLATEYGYQLVSGKQQAESQQLDSDWQPQSWQEVQDRISSSAVEQ